MNKIMLCTVSIAALCAITPASAQTKVMMECTDANYTSAMATVEKMSTGEPKTAAMKHMALAKEMMAKKDMAACKTHLNDALPDRMP